MTPVLLDPAYGTEICALTTTEDVEQLPDFLALILRWMAQLSMREQRIENSEVSMTQRTRVLGKIQQIPYKDIDEHT